MCIRDSRYLTCVVDHDTGRLVWAHEGRNKDTLTLFFDALGTTRSALLTHVSADGAEWIHSVVREKAPQAAICLDPVQGLCSPHHDMERVQANRRLRCLFPDDRVDPLRAIGRDMRQQSRSGRPEGVEEQCQGVLVAAFV